LGIACMRSQLPTAACSSAAEPFSETGFTVSPWNLLPMGSESVSRFGGGQVSPEEFRYMGSERLNEPCRGGVDVQGGSVNL